jgi:hypothetical protein
MIWLSSATLDQKTHSRGAITASGMVRQQGIQMMVSALP